MFPLWMMAAAAAAKNAIGEKQMGPPAPAPQPAGSTGVQGGLLASKLAPQSSDVVDEASKNPFSSMSGLAMAQQMNPGLGFGGALTEAPNWFKQGSTPNTSVPSGEMGPVSWQDDPNVAKPPGKFDGFFGNLDQNLQSPSKVIGLGLLNQIHPALPYAGLLGMGMNWGRK